ncbi:MAG: 16S rRNA (guanine(527)-N(7))-methyltransferase RsmG [candidate division WOR-3 bacterium]|nr:MAG: 16S rRNA (guanine(527)-N(7))-methyltransferase RsmG [candidate division WOR-3 bacterium]
MYDHDAIERELEDFRTGLTALDITFNQQTLQFFHQYLELLYHYRGKIHLISRRDYNRISRRHFLVSLMALPFIGDCRTACDLGAGAGFPSVPLKIMRPDIGFTLFESKQKKAAFLDHVIRTLGLSRITVIHGRAEHHSTQQFDVVLIKAAGRIKKLLKIVDHLMAPNGRAIFYKSYGVEEELRTSEHLLRKRGFQACVEEKLTPIEHLPLALVIVRKS